MRTRGFSRSIAAGVCVLLLGCLALPDPSHAADALTIDQSVNKILANFKEKHQGGTEALKEAKGVLVFPEIVQAGFVVGGSYGEGALRIKGTSVAYYSIGSGSFGLIAGAQAKAVVILFMTQPPLTEFRRDARTDKSWQVGLNGDITAVNVGAAGAISSAQLNRPIVSFTQDQKGLMVNLSLQGAKITRINR